MGSPREIESGFTLIELMAAVAVITALAAIAVPNYLSYAARARQAEAKVQLASVLTVEQTWAAQYYSYTDCLSQIGYTRPTGGNNYYTVGTVGVVDPVTCGPAGGLSCVDYYWTTVASCSCPASCASVRNAAANPSLIATVPGVTWQVLTSSTFVLGAYGSIRSSSGVQDQWTIDQNGNLSNTVSGM